MSLILLARIMGTSVRELEDTYFRWLERTDEQVRGHVQYRLDLVRDIIENGMKEPILVRPDRIGIDGGNRAAILSLLGYKSIIVRIT